MRVTSTSRATAMPGRRFRTWRRTRRAAGLGPFSSPTTRYYPSPDPRRLGYVRRWTATSKIDPGVQTARARRGAVVRRAITGSVVAALTLTGLVALAEPAHAAVARFSGHRAAIVGTLGVRELRTSRRPPTRTCQVAKRSGAQAAESRAMQSFTASATTSHQDGGPTATATSSGSTQQSSALAC